MKISEAFKILESKPHKKFRKSIDKDFSVQFYLGVDEDNYFKFWREKDGTILDESSTSNGLNGNAHIDDDWEEVEQSVSWQEALIAWANGASIHCQVDGKTWTYCEGGLEAIEDSNALEEEEILRGKWFIEED